MVTLGEDSQGNYKARKRLPDDVRDEYGRLYGSRFEVKFFVPASTKPNMARRLFSEWLARGHGKLRPYPSKISPFRIRRRFGHVR